MHTRVVPGDALCVILHKRPAPESTAATSVYVHNHMDGKTSWVDVGDLRQAEILPSLPLLLDVTDGSGLNEHERLFWHGGQEYRVTSQWPDGRGPWLVEHVAEDGRRTRILNEQVSAESARTAVANMVTAVRLIGGELPDTYVVEVCDRTGDRLLVDSPLSDDSGLLRGQTLQEVLDALANITTGRRAHRNGRERRIGIGFLRACPVFTDGWTGQGQLIPWPAS